MYAQTKGDVPQCARLEQWIEVKDQITRGFIALTIHKPLRTSKKTQENEEE